jgi:tetratricopeptide (TPR) repeat protein
MALSLLSGKSGSYLAVVHAYRRLGNRHTKERGASKEIKRRFPMTSQQNVISEPDKDTHATASTVNPDIHATASKVDTPARYYSLGVLNLQQRNYTVAAAYFQKCLQLDPRNANAYYYLGQLAEIWQKDLPDAALRFYKRALEINPGYKSAQQKLAALQGKAAHAIQADPGPARAAARSTAAGAGVYEFLQNDQSILGRHTVQLIDAVDSLGPVRPRLSAWAEWIFGRISGCLLLLLGVFVLGKQVSLPNLVWPAVLALDVYIVGELAITIVRLKTTKYTFDKGRLRISAGIFSKSQENVELYRVEDVKLEQNFINRLTGDGTITLFVQSGHQKRHSVKLGGIARIDRLGKLFDDLRSLILLLRTGTWGKGIIY